MPFAADITRRHFHSLPFFAYFAAKEARRAFDIADAMLRHTPLSRLAFAMPCPLFMIAFHPIIETY